MEFRTAIKLSEDKKFIKHSDGVMMLGSCFSDNVGARLRDAMLHVDINPFGTLYNPASILEAVKRIVTADAIKEDEIFYANGVWNNFDFHSKFSSNNKAEALGCMNRRLTLAHEHLKRARVLAVTLGTSIIYINNASGKVVGNCHKLPAAEFTRRMMNVDEVREKLVEIVKTVKQVNAEIKVIFTVSPIRHVSDGLERNQLSKAILRVAVGDVVKQEAQCDYFPAFEIMMDDLRDYRFYASDMVHPSEVAVDYIWSAFQGTYFDDRTAQAVARCERVSKRLMHRPMTDNVEVIEKFKNETKAVVQNLVKEYPYIENLLQIKNILHK